MASTCLTVPAVPPGRPLLAATSAAGLAVTTTSVTTSIAATIALAATLSALGSLFITRFTVGELVFDTKLFQCSTTTQLDAILIVDIDYDDFHRIADLADVIYAGDIAA